MLCRRGLRVEIVLARVSQDWRNLCKGSFVAERPRITGLMRIVTDMLSSLIPINVVAFPQIFKILRIASFDAVYF